MKLYGSFTSPYVRHCRIALLQNAEKHEFIEAGFDTSARLSPSMKVPFLQTDKQLLSDSSTILRFIREQQGKPFLAQLQHHDLFCLISTLMDSAINLFYLEKEGIDSQQSSYLQRQQQRVEAGLYHLEEICPADADLFNDAQLRLGIFLAWGQFRQRFSLASRPKLQSFLTQCDSDAHFIATKPPG